MTIPENSWSRLEQSHNKLSLEESYKAQNEVPSTVSKTKKMEQFLIENAFNLQQAVESNDSKEIKKAVSVIGPYEFQIKQMNPAAKYAIMNEKREALEVILKELKNFPSSIDFYDKNILLIDLFRFAVAKGSTAVIDLLFKYTKHSDLDDVGILEEVLKEDQAFVQTEAEANIISNERFNKHMNNFAYVMEKLAKLK